MDRNGQGRYRPRHSRQREDKTPTSTVAQVEGIAVRSLHAAYNPHDGDLLQQHHRAIHPEWRSVRHSHFSRKPLQPIPPPLQCDTWRTVSSTLCCTSWNTRASPDRETTRICLPLCSRPTPDALPLSCISIYCARALHR